MNWTVIFHEEFLPEFSELPLEAQDKLIALADQRFKNYLENQK